MLALGLDTSTASASAGLADDRGILGEVRLPAGVTCSESLLPVVGDLLSSAGRTISQVERLAVTTGPGSFTGLRIGMASAKGLAMGLGRPLAGFSTLESVAVAAARLTGAPVERPICVLLEAGRGEIYRGLYRVTLDEPLALQPDAAVPRAQALSGLPAECLFAGDGLAGLEGPAAGASVLAGGVPVLGGVVALRAARRLREGPIVPNYLRLSDAELTFRG